ncbi:hypothetical protein [Virgibacillus senegalensis]|uniref:hypothetical protein n=1 Tax=Virgibacillus senegalensis TaxID=1499679 RepID=UPI00069E1BE6|nr:hypothetical protein [Virgibacillus senegalensis]
MVFISVFVLTTLISAVALLHNHQHVTSQFHEQLKVDTLLQMGEEQFYTEQQEIIIACPEKTWKYDFPYGETTIHCENLTDGILTAIFTIQTDNGTLVNKLVKLQQNSN